MKDEYEKLLVEIEKYTDRKLKEILKKYHLVQCGLKADKMLRMKNYILVQLNKSPVKVIKMCICEECVTKKIVSDENFRKMGGGELSWYHKICIKCEESKCKTEMLYRKPVHTKIVENSLTKTCSGCKVVKSYDDFHKNKSNRDGLVSRCKDCESYRKSGTKVRLEKKRPVGVPVGSKWCPKCEVVKDGTCFRKASKRKDGLQSMCRDCDNEAKRRNRLKNKLYK